MELHNSEHCVDVQENTDDISSTELKDAPRVLSLREKIAYGCGDVGNNFLFDMGQLYLLKFYTDQLRLPSAIAGSVFLVAKIWDTFADISVGTWVDNQKKISKRGKFRPFILFTAIPLALMLIANFSTPNFNLTGKIVWSYLMYMFQLISCFNIKENYTPELTVIQQTEKPKLREQFKAILHNKPLVALCLANLFTFSVFNVKLAVQVYYAQYVLKEMSAVSYLGLFSIGCVFPGVIVTPILTKRIGKKGTYIVGCMI